MDVVVDMDCLEDLARPARDGVVALGPLLAPLPLRAASPACSARAAAARARLIQIVGGLEPATERQRAHRRSRARREPRPLGRRFGDGLAEPQSVSLAQRASTMSPSVWKCAACPKRERYRARARADRLGRACAASSSHLPGQLSGGMRQRVALARALIMERPILLMDEPFAALDAQTKIVMQEELLRIFDQTHKTIIFVTHAIEEAILLGDEVVVMTARPGRIKEVMPVDLPRPRSLEMVNSQEFGALFDRAFHLIREEVMTSMAQQAHGAGRRMSAQRACSARCRASAARRSSWSRSSCCLGSCSCACAALRRSTCRRRARSPSISGA